MKGSLDSSKRKQGLETLRLIFLIFFALFSIAAWWDEKKEMESEKKALPQTANQILTAESAQVKEVSAKKEAVSIQKAKPLPKDQAEAQKQLAEESGRQREEVSRIQGELKEIINRTQHLQNQVK